MPTGSTFYETKRLRDKYGYPDKNYKGLKKLNTAIPVIAVILLSKIVRTK